MPPAHERLKRQFAKFVTAVSKVLDLRVDGDKDKINEYFDERNAEKDLPEDLKLTSRFDILEDGFKIKFDEEVRKRKELEVRIDDYIGRSWWRRFLGVGPKKEKIILKIGSNN